MNSLWRCSRGRFHRAPRYQQWLDLHSLITRPANPIPAPAAIAITLHQGKGWGTNRDLDNIAKPIIDLLCHLGILDDDSTKTVRQITMVANPPADAKARARVEVTAKTIQPTKATGEVNGVSYGSQPPPDCVGGNPEEKIGEGGKKNRNYN